MPARLTATELEARLPSTLRLLGSYQGTKKHSRWECVSCGFTFAATPNSVLRTGCKECNLTERRLHRAPAEHVTHDLFRERAWDRGLLVLGQYQGARSPVQCQCRTCSHVWEPLPTNVYRHGCPKCATAKQRKLDHNAFMELMAGRPLIVLSAYQDSRTAIRFACAKCWCIRRRRADHLIRSKGNPCVQCGLPRLNRSEDLRKRRERARHRYQLHRERILERQRERRHEGDSYNAWQRRHRAWLKETEKALR